MPKAIQEITDEINETVQQLKGQLQGGMTTSLLTRNTPTGMVTTVHGSAAIYYDANANHYEAIRAERSERSEPVAAAQGPAPTEAKAEVENQEAASTQSFGTQTSTTAERDRSQPPRIDDDTRRELFRIGRKGARGEAKEASTAGKQASTTSSEGGGSGAVLPGNVAQRREPSLRDLFDA